MQTYPSRQSESCSQPSMQKVRSKRGQRGSVLSTWPAQAGLPQIAIDHIFISPGLKLIEAAQIGEPGGSDHYPVSARIAVPLTH